MRGRLRVSRIELDRIRRPARGPWPRSRHLRVVARGDRRQRRHDALHVHHHQVDRAGEQRQFLVQVVAGDRHALPHQDLVGRAADAGHVDALGAGLPRASASSSASRLASTSISLSVGSWPWTSTLTWRSSSTPRLARDRIACGPAEQHVLHVGGDHRSAPAVGQRGAHGAAQQRDGIGFHAVVRAVQQLDDLAVDAARRDAERRPARSRVLRARAAPGVSVPSCAPNCAVIARSEIAGDVLDGPARRRRCPIRRPARAACSGFAMA